MSRNEQSRIIGAACVRVDCDSTTVWLADQSDALGAGDRLDTIGTATACDLAKETVIAGIAEEVGYECCLRGRLGDVGDQELVAFNVVKMFCCRHSTIVVNGWNVGCAGTCYDGSKEKDG